MIKLIASDMDGTLVNNKGNINEEMFYLIDTLIEKGVNFAAASGRFYSQLKNNFKKVKGDMIITAHNGAIVRHSKTGKTIYSNSISENDINYMLSLNPEFDGDLFLAAADEAYIINPSKNMMKIFDNYDVPVIVVNSFNEVKSPIYKITYHANNGIKKNMINYIKNNLNENLDFVLSGSNWLDVMNKDVSKGNALRMIQEKLKIDKNNTMVFGDYYNDLTMFDAAYYSYAMENAPDDVKSRARFIAKSNNDNGVYQVVNEYAASLL